MVLTRSPRDEIAKVEHYRDIFALEDTLEEAMTDKAPLFGGVATLRQTVIFEWTIADPPRRLYHTYGAYWQLSVSFGLLTVVAAGFLPNLRSQAGCAEQALGSTPANSEPTFRPDHRAVADRG